MSVPWFASDSLRARRTVEGEAVATVEVGLEIREHINRALAVRTLYWLVLAIQIELVPPDSAQAADEWAHDLSARAFLLDVVLKRLARDFNFAAAVRATHRLDAQDLPNDAVGWLDVDIHLEVRAAERATGCGSGGSEVTAQAAATEDMLAWQFDGVVDDLLAD